jgi:hypothetical protein
MIFIAFLPCIRCSNNVISIATVIHERRKECNYSNRELNQSNVIDCSSHVSAKTDFLV